MRRALRLAWVLIFMRVRFAPSPTGALHIGGARTARTTALTARRDGGGNPKDARCCGSKIPTGSARPRRTSADPRCTALARASTGTRDRSSRPPTPSAIAWRLRAARIRARVSLNATREDVDAYKAEHGADRGFRGVAEESGAVRLRVPDDGFTAFEDVIRGEIRHPHASMDDPVIARADGRVSTTSPLRSTTLTPRITHVVRGEDHISNTPKQLLVFEALGGRPPRYAHLPLLHGPDGKKLSKRHGAASVQELRDAATCRGGRQLHRVARAGFAADEEYFTLASSPSGSGSSGSRRTRRSSTSASCAT